MKNIFLTLALLLTVSFAFAGNSIEKITTFDVKKTIKLANTVEFLNNIFQIENNLNKLVNIDDLGQCWVQVIVTETNIITGESYSYTYWAYAGSATDLADCKKKAAAYVAGIK